MQVRFIDSPPLAGDFNMACDFTLTSNMLSDGEAIFRLYSWKKPTISLGYHQHVEDIDLNRCAHDGIDVVRRPTGGRAILHSGEITYCFISKIETRSPGSALRDIYRKVHSGILKAVGSTAPKVSLSDGSRSPQRHHPLCFASAAGTELVLGGRKVVGSAQRLLNSNLLQHGSILLSPEHLKLPEYLSLSEDARFKLSENLKKSSAHLPLKDTPELRNRLADAIADEFQGELTESTLTKEEIIQIESNRKRFNLNNSQENL